MSTPDELEPTAGDDLTIEHGSHLSAVLFLLRKAHAELVGETAAHARRATVLTRGEARRYAAEILPLLRAERERRRQARRSH